MRWHTILWRELLVRKGQLMTSALAVTIGIAAITSIRTISHYSELAVAREMDSLGANVLVLPKDATVQSYYSADLSGTYFPEEYVGRLTLSDLEGLDNLSPKLSTPVEKDGVKLTLTGILPKSEFQAKSAWRSAGIFSRPIGCGATVSIVNEAANDPSAMARKRLIDSLAADECLLGSDAADALQASEGDEIELLGRSFRVVTELPPTGTVDDARVFAHLHTVQELTGKGAVVNAIEVVGCCREISGGLVEKIATILPETKVVTISQIADAQVRVHDMMANLSLALVGILAVVGGAGIGNDLSANVRERRKEIGTLMALGATRFSVLRLVLAKGLVLGAAGGTLGYVVGCVAAAAAGPSLAGVQAPPLLTLFPWMLTLAVVVALVAGGLPAWRASRLDPCEAFKEV